MTQLSVVVADILTALKTVKDVRPTSDPAKVDPPAAFVGPPALRWEGLCGRPTSAQFSVFVIVQVDERAIERLLELVPAVASALDVLPDVTVIRADPGVFAAGGQELPSYEIQIEVPLS